MHFSSNTFKKSVLWCQNVYPAVKHFAKHIFNAKTLFYGGKTVTQLSNTFLTVQILLRDVKFSSSYGTFPFQIHFNCQNPILRFQTSRSVIKYFDKYISNSQNSVLRYQISRPAVKCFVRYIFNAKILFCDVKILVHLSNVSLKIIFNAKILFCNVKILVRL